MNPYAVILLIFIILGMFVGVATRFYQNMGVNIGKNHMRDLGVEDTEDDQDKI